MEKSPAAVKDHISAASERTDVAIDLVAEKILNAIYAESVTKLQRQKQISREDKPLEVKRDEVRSMPESVPPPPEKQVALD